MGYEEFTKEGLRDIVKFNAESFAEIKGRKYETAEWVCKYSDEIDTMDKKELIQILQEMNREFSQERPY